MIIKSTTFLSGTISLLLLMISLKAASQAPEFPDSDTTYQIKKKIFFWYSPSKATQVNGVMFHLFFDESNLPTINGAEIDLNPLSPLMAGTELFFAFFSKDFHTMPLDYNTLKDVPVDSMEYTEFKKINGLKISLLDLEPCIVNGLEIGLSGTTYTKLNGMVLSGILNKHYILNGVTFAFVGNYTKKCRGLQIGAINNCEDLRGFQIGLLNTNQKRITPFINWSFKKAKKPSDK